MLAVLAVLVVLAALARLAVLAVLAVCYCARNNVTRKISNLKKGSGVKKNVVYENGLGLKN